MLSNCKFLRVTSLHEVKENNGISENVSLHLLPIDYPWKLNESACEMLIVKLENICSASRSDSSKETSIY